ncbi:MAG: sucrose-6F-phosphate phosphohydrolase-domain-containing protein [Monoraphidium minutum]|nr:MAG: sucrose-6F-phosphate phosphohydrolase-domain-containing protein [Monoraphidium minutum]
MGLTALTRSAARHPRTMAAPTAHTRPRKRSSSVGSAAPGSGASSSGVPPLSLSLLRPLLLVSDLDDTLIGGEHTTAARDEHTAALRDMLHAARTAGDHPVRVAINTGRTLPQFEAAAAAKAHCLPAVDALILGVGTRVYYPAPGSPAAGWVEDPGWTAAMSEGWSHAAVTSLVDRAIARFGADSVYSQRPIEQHEHKLGLLYSGHVRDDLTAMLADGLAAAGVEATIVDGIAAPKFGAGWRVMDLLPRRAGKGAAMAWVRGALGFGAEHTVACGDGANDMLMLEEAEAAICVGNCQPELAAWARQTQEAAAAAAAGAGGGPGEPSAAAAGRKRVHLARPDAHAAAGILEGLHALGWVG